MIINEEMYKYVRNKSFQSKDILYDTNIRFILRQM
jgi:hypothetical protein